MKKITDILNSRFSAAVLAGLVLTFPWQALLAAEGEPAHAAPLILLWIPLILILAKMSSLVERWRQPAVLGELIVGVILGNLTLLGINQFEVISSDPIITFLAELGVIILLFQIGLESNIRQMRSVGLNALLVAIVGVVVPFVLGTYLVGPWLLPGLPSAAYLFLGASLTATSVGITARVFKDVGALQSREAQIVLGAAVIDDVLGLIILAVVSAIATVGTVTAGAVSLIFIKAIIFLGGAILLGQYLAPKISLWVSKIHSGVEMKFTLAFGFGLIFAYLASLIGLAPIVGAFAAGLILDPVVFRHFKRPEMVESLEEVLKDADDRTRARVEGVIERGNAKHIEELIEPLAFFLVPIFFVHVGMQLDLLTFLNLPILLTALGITAVAFIGKIVAGLAAGRGTNKWLVGFGMVPRGEVGLIFATIGASLGVINESVFSVIFIMIFLTTLVTPPILTMLLHRRALHP